MLIRTHRSPRPSRALPTRFWTMSLRTTLALAGCAALAPAANAQSQQQNPCAIYGSGYVAVVGSGGCARIGERVRLGGSATPSGGYSAAGDRFDGAGRAHLRVPAFNSRHDTPRTR
jgi:hypothetical protein